MVVGYWIALGLVSALVACADAGHTSVAAETSSGAVVGTSSSDGGGESTSTGVGELPPSPCGEVVTADCQSTNAIAFDADGQLVLGGWDLGPRLRIVNTDGATQWDDRLGQRGSFDDVAVLPGGRLVGVGSTGSLARGELSGFARGYEVTGDVAWIFDAEIGSSFGPTTWWDSAQRLAVAVTRSGSNELWFYDADGGLRTAEDLENVRVDGLAVLGDGLIACAVETLVHYDADLTRVGERTFAGLSCASLVSDGDRLAMIIDREELVLLDDALDDEWSASLTAGGTLLAFHRDKVVVASPGTAEVPTRLEWFSPSGEPLWTIDHALPPATVLPGPLAVDGDRLWVGSIEADGCLRTRLACFEQPQ